MKQLTVEEAIAELAATFLSSLLHKHPTENQSKVSVSVSLIKQLYDYADDDVRETIEQELPTLFPRPTFRIGDRIKQFFKETDVDGTRDLLIVGPPNASITGQNRIVLVDLKNGQIRQETTAVNNPDHITEKELLEAGKAFGLTRSTYAKL